MSLWNGIKSYINDFFDDGDSNSVKWSNIDSHFEQLVIKLRYITSNNEQPTRIGIKVIIQHITDITPIIKSQRIIYGQSNDILYQIQALFLEIWNHLLTFIKHYIKLQIINLKKEKNKRKKEQKEQEEQTNNDKQEETKNNNHLSKVISTLTMNEISIIYCAVNYLMNRKEFTLETLQCLNEEEDIEKATIQFKIAHRYRSLLIQTQILAQRLASYQHNSGKVGSRITYVFIAKVFATTCFRIPKVLSLIVCGVSLNEEIHKEIDSYLPDNSFKIINDDTFYSDIPKEKLSTYYMTSDSEFETHSFEEPKNPFEDDEPFSKSPVNNTPPSTPERNTSPQDRVLKMAELFPNLFQWPQFHSRILTEKFDNANDNIVSGDWLEEFKKRDSMLFFIFLYEWIEHVRYIVDDNDLKDIDWPVIRGYRTFIPSFIYAMNKSTTFTKDIQDCSCSVLFTDTSIINFLLKNRYLQTNVYNVFDTVNTIVHTEMWFNYIKEYNLELSLSFDYKFFGKAIEIILQTDHHQIMTRCLSMLFSILDVFTGDARVSIVIDILLHKYFFRLFLHWDSSIRNCYQHILLFKALRAKRSELIKVRLSNDRDINGPSVHDMEHITDTVIYSKIESYLRMLEDQVLSDTKRTRKDFPQELEVYTRRALEEYTSYKKYYFYWERSNQPKPNKIIPYASLSEEFKST